MGEASALADELKDFQRKVSKAAARSGLREPVGTTTLS